MNKNTDFCKDCHNLLKKDIYDNKLKLHCYNCNKFYDINPEDTLIYFKDKLEDVSIYDNLILNIDKNPLCYRKEQYCQNCKDKTITKQIRIKDLKPVNYCMKCNQTYF
tara:strand:- start:232 stop:555 length:324 start_codon:yes stop_codon:yes gene_type:complete